MNQKTEEKVLEICKRLPSELWYGDTEEALREAIQYGISIGREEMVKQVKEIVLQNSKETYIGSSGFLLGDTDKIMFSLNALNPTGGGH